MLKNKNLDDLTKNDDNTIEEEKKTDIRNEPPKFSLTNMTADSNNIKIITKLKLSEFFRFERNFI